VNQKSTRRKHTLPQLIPWQGHDRLARNSSPPLTATDYWWSGLHWTAKVDHSQSATNILGVAGVRPFAGTRPRPILFARSRRSAPRCTQSLPTWTRMTAWGRGLPRPPQLCPRSAGSIAPTLP